jgi:hypothetical protein
MPWKRAVFEGREQKHKSKERGKEYNKMNVKINKYVKIRGRSKRKGSGEEW